jgi:hypothetical protein
MTQGHIQPTRIGTAFEASPLTASTAFTDAIVEGPGLTSQSPHGVFTVSSANAEPPSHTSCSVKDHIVFPAASTTLTNTVAPTSTVPALKPVPVMRYCGWVSPQIWFPSESVEQESGIQDETDICGGRFAIGGVPGFLHAKSRQTSPGEQQ